MALPHAPYPMPDVIKVDSVDFADADPDSIQMFLTLHFDNGIAQFKLVGLEFDDETGAPTGTMVFERTLSEVVPS